MTPDLSAAAEMYIANALASGAYASRGAVLEAAIEALREKGGSRQAAAAEAFGTVTLTPEECAHLQRISEGSEAPHGHSAGDSKTTGYTIPE